MDEIFQECHGFKGAFDVVKIANEKPNRYDKNGDLLISYDDTELAHRRHSSAAGGVAIPHSHQPYAEKSEGNTTGSEERREQV